MPTIKDYSIIETEWINERISIYKNYINELSKDFNKIEENKIEILRHKSILSEYEVLKSKLKPLIPILENAFRQGERFARHDIREIETGEKNITLDLPEYIKQLLNNE